MPYRHDVSLKLSGSCLVSRVCMTNTSKLRRTLNGSILRVYISVTRYIL